MLVKLSYKLVRIRSVNVAGLLDGLIAALLDALAILLLAELVLEHLGEQEVTTDNGGGHTEYWIGNTMIGGIDSDGNVWGDTFATYSGPINGGTVGVG